MPRSISSSMPAVAPTPSICAPAFDLRARLAADRRVERLDVVGEQLNFRCRHAAPRKLPGKARRFLDELAPRRHQKLIAVSSGTRKSLRKPGSSMFKPRAVAAILTIRRRIAARITEIFGITNRHI
jgi:hypothetical protein